jgi:DNA-binding NarL/FixJ family response regulator
MTDQATRVLLIDDHEMSRRGLEAMLSTADWLEVVGDADGCATGLMAVDRLLPDLVLLDIRMPGMDGLACLDAIKRRHEEVPVVIVTLYDDRTSVLEAIRRGAAGYVLKDASTADLLATLTAVADGQLAIDPGLLREALTPGATPRRGPEAAGGGPDSFGLTAREVDVLRRLAEGLTNKEIGGELAIAEDTVKKHVQSIIAKLRAADRTQAAIIAYRSGLLDAASA